MKLFTVTIMPVGGGRPIVAQVLALDAHDAFAHTCWVNRAAITTSDISGFSVTPVECLVTEATEKYAEQKNFVIG